MDDFFSIDTFNGINEYLANGLMNTNEAVEAYNCDINNGSLKTTNTPPEVLDCVTKIDSLMVFYDTNSSSIMVGSNGALRDNTNTSLYEVNNTNLDSINFEYNGKRIMVCCSKSDNAFIIGGHGNRKLKNRRISYDKKGVIDGYIDANGVKKDTEEQITTYAPKGEFIELHYDRVWIAGDSSKPDRLYFSTAGVNGADIEDWTAPIEEAEANQHGGFIDVRSYDGGKIIGMKVIFNSIVVFKNKTAYKVFGNNPGNYELVQLFSSNGAIADKSICVGDNGAFFLNDDGIYFYDGTNTNLISQKIQNTIKKMNKNYASKSVGYFYNNKYYLAIPLGNSTSNNLLIEYDIGNKSYMFHKLGSISGFVEYGNDLLFSTGQYVKSLTNGTDAMSLKWVTSNYDYGKKNSRKNSNYIYFRGKGEGSVKFKVITENKTKEIEIPLTSTETLYKKKLKNKGRLFRIEIENVNNSSFEITSPQLSTEVDLD